MDGRDEVFNGEHADGTRYRYGRLATIGYRSDYNEDGAIVGGQYVASLTGEIPADAVSDEIAAAILAACMRLLVDCGITPAGFQRAIIGLMGELGSDEIA